MQAGLIIGDWGNSNARAWLCGADGTVLDERRGPGIAVLRSDGDAIAAAFADLIQGWPADIPALLAGVVGASFGWRDAGYLACPIAVAAIGTGLVRAPTNGRAVWIAPGLRCTNAWGMADTMRGEELQLAGWAAQHGEPEALVVMPGTHCKWTRLSCGHVEHFHSAISGELFALLRDHSVMVDRTARDAPHDAAAFADGVALARAAAGVDLAALLFGARAQQAVGAMPPVAAPSFLSGIIIGADVRTALHLYGGKLPVAVIGEAALSARYIAALGDWGVSASVVDGDAAMRAGLMAVAQAAGIAD